MFQAKTNRHDMIFHQKSIISPVLDLWNAKLKCLKTTSAHGLPPTHQRANQREEWRQIMLQTMLQAKTKSHDRISHQKSIISLVLDLWKAKLKCVRTASAVGSHTAKSKSQMGMVTDCVPNNVSSQGKQTRHDFRSEGHYLTGFWLVKCKTEMFDNNHICWWFPHTKQRANHTQRRMMTDHVVNNSIKSHDEISHQSITIMTTMALLLWWKHVSFRLWGAKSSAPHSSSPRTNK